MPLPEPAATPRPRPALRVLALLLAVAAVGLPVNHLAGFGLLLAAAIVVFTAGLTTSLARWALALLAVLLANGIAAVLEPPRIEEGHNVFLADGAKAPLAAVLPEDVHRFMQAEFDRLYPAARRCDPARQGCWRGEGFPDRAFAFSADGIFDRSQLSRRVDGIDFRDPLELRLGAINELRYNWYPVASDLQRLLRDGRAWKGLDRFTLLTPWYVAWRFPPAFVGSALCWTGDVLWEGADGRHSPWRHATPACRTLAPEDVGRTIYGVAIAPNALSMRLDPPRGVTLRQQVETAVRFAAAIAVLVLLVRTLGTRVLLPVLLVALALPVIIIDDASFLGGFRPHDGGDDGLVYESFARTIVQHLLAGDVAGALMGVEPVYYFGGPGLRYLRAAERFLFGDTNLGYLALVLLLPMLVFALFRRFLSTRWALVLALAFVAAPAGALFGSTYYHYVQYAARGYADPAAYILLIAGLLVVVGSAAEARDRFWSACGGGWLLALAVFVRPNLAPLAGVLVAGAGLMALAAGQGRRMLGLGLGFAFVLVMPLHNWVFGGVFVLFSSNAANAELLVMPPSAYLAALGELVRLDLGGTHVSRMISVWAGHLSGPAESYALIPLHAAAVAVVVHVALRGRGYDPWLRVIAVGTLAQHGVGLFYNPNPRYVLVTWLLTFVVVAAWLRTQGLAWLRARAPAASERVMQSGLVRTLQEGVTNLEKRVGL